MTSTCKLRRALRVTVTSSNVYSRSNPRSLSDRSGHALLYSPHAPGRSVSKKRRQVGPKAERESRSISAGIQFISTLLPVLIIDQPKPLDMMHTGQDSNDMLDVDLFLDSSKYLSDHQRSVQCLSAVALPMRFEEKMEQRVEEFWSRSEKRQEDKPAAPARDHQCAKPRRRPNARCCS